MEDQEIIQGGIIVLCPASLSVLCICLSSVKYRLQQNVDELQYVTFLDQLMPVSNFFLEQLIRKQWA
jgi:hypothetical protein